MLRLFPGARAWNDERELAHAVHGTVVGAAVLAAASLHGTLAEVVISVVVTLFVYWIAERYADILASGVHGVSTRARIARSLRDGWPMIESATAPLILLIVVTLLTRDLQLGATIALFFATFLLTGLGALAAWNAGSTGMGVLGWALASGSLGVVVSVLKLLLH